MKDLSLKKDERGFTLVEVMITVTVTVLAIVGVIGSNILIQHNVASATDRTMAYRDASRVIEEMRDAANTAGKTFQPIVQTAATAATASVGAMPAAYNEVIAVTYANTSADPLAVTVTVTWQDRGLTDAGAARSIVLRASITRR